MPEVPGYQQFNARHWETGALRNVLAHQGVTNPHTNEPFTEAMLLGIGGGISVLYFVFEYEGHPPHLYLGTRNPEDVIGAVGERLGLPVNVQETTSAKKAAANLTSALAAGRPAIVWANVYDLPYTALPGIGFPGMFPIVVYGYDEATGLAHIADRARVPLTVTTRELDTARGAQGSTKHRLITLGAPEGLDRLPAAVEAGIRSAMTIFTEGWTKGPKSNFGLAALRKWAALVADPGDKKGWPHVFPPGPHLYDALVMTYEAIEGMGSGGAAARPLYADFLDEAADVLGKPDLGVASAKFRASGARWIALAQALLPEEVAPLRETRELLRRRHDLFITQGMASLDERRAISERLATIKTDMATEFPLSAGEVTTFYEELRARILAVYEVEAAAVQAVQNALP
jgi:hypothetical protein